MLTAEQELDPRAWSFAEACAAVDVRDWDRSALSGIPKRSGRMGLYSHHHRQLRRHGNDSPANLVLIIGSGSNAEHGWMHQHPALAELLGYIVPSWADPAEVPIWRLDAYGQAWGWHRQTVNAQLEPCGPPADPMHELGEALRVFDELVTRNRLDAVGWL